MSIIQINSDTLILTEQHFKVTAGPGAGKTHWLINHLKNVIHKSNRLGKSKKIACITYTNIAVNTILAYLKASSDRVEVSTIHSFLYKNIIKPYVSFIADKYSLNVQKLDGHDDTILSHYHFLEEWKSRTGQQRIRENNKIIEAIKKARWKFDNDDSDNLIIKPEYPIRVNNYPIRNDSYFEYKKMAWERGVLHHDDVLFLSYQLILNFPFILQVLRAKFPYFFVDEFQDTHPIQTKILEKIGEEETIVGVIGDIAQSIYSFQGAKPTQFSSFTLPGMLNYQMTDNRRSTNQIIDFFNAIRSDISQDKYRNEEGEKPTLIVGDMISSLSKVQELCSGEFFYSLSRDNNTANAIKRKMSNNIPSEDLLQKLYEIDSNPKRKELIIACIKATELIRQKCFKESIKELKRIFRDKQDRDREKKVVLKHIIMLISNYDYFKDKLLIDFHSFIKNKVKKISDFRGGVIKEFYENHTYQQLAVCVKITEDNSFHRTIHKAKGTEFDNVLLILKKEEDLKFILTPDFEGERGEEDRINYVAVSRARKRLFITVPNLTDINNKKLNPLLNIIKI